ncbi:MAG: hypothetical protein GY781_13845 [Gammaproteobacteria bacterium]|nr:hypothetical protein [Gammaproteobacteria bacterium]
MKALRNIKQNIIDLAGGVGVPFSYIDTTQKDIDTTTTETELYSFTLDGDVLGTGSGILMEIPFLDTDIQNTRSMTIRLKYGGTTVVTAVFNNASGGPNPVAGMLKLWLLSAGTVSTQKGIITGLGLLENPTFASTSTMSYLSGTTPGTSSEDSTADQTVTVTVQFSTATGGDEITTEGIIVKSI